ncbi:unnamed protein product, partial [Closterium sp. Yama58-4]
RHVYGAVEQLCASMAAAAANHSNAAQDEVDAAAAKRAAMCLNILEVLFAMPMPPASKPGGKRLVAEEGQGGGDKAELLSTWALPAPLSGGAQQGGAKKSAGGKRARQAGQQGSRKRAVGMKVEGEREEEGEQGAVEAEERRAAVVGEERKALAGAWLGLLALPLPLDAYKKVLGGLPNLIPHLPNPLLLSDFLTVSYEQGGACAVAALAALFRLVTEHGLECPQYYPRLYRLLDSSVFRAAHRAKFFELLDGSLASPLLPAYMAAAFTKQLCRLSLSAPPAGAIVVVALAHNLLRRHPAIAPLVHRTASPDTLQVRRHSLETLQDSSSDEEDAGEQKQDSSLWEVEALQRHYCPAVSRFVASLEKDLSERSSTMELNVADFSATSYGTIMADELGRRVKAVPLAFFERTPTTLFPTSSSPTASAIPQFAKLRDAMAQSLVLRHAISAVLASSPSTSQRQRPAANRARTGLSASIGDFSAAPIPESQVVPRLCHLEDFHESSTGEAGVRPVALAVRVVEDGHGKQLADLLMATVEASAQVEDLETQAGRAAMVALALALLVEFATGNGIFSAVDRSALLPALSLGVGAAAVSAGYAVAWRSKRHVSDILARGCLHWLDAAVDHVIDGVFDARPTAHQAPPQRD